MLYITVQEPNTGQQAVYIYSEITVDLRSYKTDALWLKCHRLGGSHRNLGPQFGTRTTYNERVGIYHKCICS